jgi:hypothetical protein
MSIFTLFFDIMSGPVDPFDISAAAPERPHLFIACHRQLQGQATLGEDRREVLLNLLECNIGSGKVHVPPVALEHAANPHAEHGAKENIRVQHERPIRHACVVQPPSEP